MPRAGSTCTQSRRWCGTIHFPTDHPQCATPVLMVRTGTSASRRYCGTIHFPTDHTQWADAAHCINTDPYTRFFICQPIQCSGTGKLHVHFYVEF